VVAQLRSVGFCQVWASIAIAAWESKWRPPSQPGPTAHVFSKKDKPIECLLLHKSKGLPVRWHALKLLVNKMAVITFQTACSINFYNQTGRDV
jgi:hypothetical protein